MSQQPSDRGAETRCAIYTRKSTENGLEKEFNSLDAQREAGEAYIASQKHEGWICLPDQYNDGGFSGGNMERPALERLLNDVRDGKVDCVVVYKIDRLSRSLMDFAKIVEVLDQHNASFVSVTQQFNTKDSMGRLTLNILLSFAQFEREIISERIRDKVAASRKKGKWTGGMPTLGYDIDHTTGRLVVNEEEADQVRQLFNLYLELKSLRRVVVEASERGWTTKTWMTKRGTLHQGLSFTNQRLSYLLRNTIYIGKIRHKDQLYEGEHQAIIDEDTWNEVQAQLKLGSQIPDQPRNRYQSLLQGMLHCTACNTSMVHLPVTKKGNKLYRYYVCRNAQANGFDKCPNPTLPADEVERFVLERLVDLGSNEHLLDEVVKQVQILQDERIENLQREARRIQLRIETLQQGDEPEDKRQRRSLEAQLRSLNERVEELKTHSIKPEQCENALGQFETLLANLTVDEKSWLIKLVFERIDFDSESGTLKFHLHDKELLTTSAE